MRKGSKWAWAAGLVVLLVLMTVVFAACGGTEEATTTTAAGGTVTTAAQTQTTAAPAGAQTLKIGMILNYTFPLDVDWQKEMEALVPALNAAGGLDIGGQKYTIELIMEDSKGNAETARAAAGETGQPGQSEVHPRRRDCRWLAGGHRTGGRRSWWPTPRLPACSSRQNKLAFNAGYFNTQAPIIWDWFAKNFPDIKTFAGAYIDAPQGQAEAGKLQALAKAFGKEVVALEFYAPGYAGLQRHRHQDHVEEPRSLHHSGWRPGLRLAALQVPAALPAGRVSSSTPFR